MPDIEKGKKGKRRRSLRAYQNMSQPVNPEAAALIDRFPADEDDEPARKAAGNPVDMPGTRNPADRLSPSRAAGQGAPSPGDHNAAAWQDPMNAPGPGRLALGHPDMRQGTTTPFPLSMLRTYNGDNEGGVKDITLGMGRVNLQRLDAAAASGLSSAPGNPAIRPMDHIARDNVGGPNGGHSLSSPTSTPRPSMKNSERLEVMKRHMFPGSGGTR